MLALCSFMHCWFKLLTIVSYSPNKHDFIIAKYKNLLYVPRLARDKDDYDSRDDINKVQWSTERTEGTVVIVRSNFMPVQEPATWRLACAYSHWEQTQIILTVIRGTHLYMLPVKPANQCRYTDSGRG